MSVLTAFRPLELFEIAIMLSLPRIYAFMSASRIFTTTTISTLPRTAAILALSLIVAPLNMGAAKRFDQSVGSLIVDFSKEYAVGFVLGFFVAWVFWFLQSAGSLIDNQRGASIASSIDPLLGSDSTPLGDLLSLTFTAYIYATGAILQVLGILFLSFKAWPPGSLTPILPPSFSQLILRLFDYAMRLSFDVAAPFLAVMFLAEFSLAMVSRFAPQLQVFILAMPIKSMLAILMLIFYGEILFPFANHQLLEINFLSGRLFAILHYGESLRGAMRAPVGGAP